MNFSRVSNIDNGTDDINRTRLGRNEELAKIEIAVQATILYFALFGNIAVLVVLCLRRKKLSRMQWFIVHLSCADLFVAIFNILPQMIWDITYRFYGNDFMCRFVKYFQVVAMYASSYVLVMCAVDRYLSICHPLSSRTSTPFRGHLMVLGAWVVSLLFSLPQAIMFYLKQLDSEVYDCWVDFVPEWTMQLYITWFAVAVFIAPVIILTIAYGCICHVVWQSMKTKESISKSTAVPTNKSLRKPCRISFRHENGKLMEGYNDGMSKRGSSSSSAPRTHTRDSSSSSAPRAHTQRLSRTKMKTIKLTLTVILCYIVCWAPFFVVQVWSAYDVKAPFNESGMVIIFLLASLNSCTNPWIYLAFTDHLCTKAKRRFSRPPTSSFLDSGTRSTMMETNSRKGVNRRESEYSQRLSTSNF